MYVKVFRDIIDSTLSDLPVATRWVFLTLLVTADQDGYVASCDSAIARQANLPIQDVTDALVQLSSPDPNSNNREHDGARIVRPTEGNRGWIIVTYAHYREMVKSVDKRRANRDRVAAHRARKKEGLGACNASVIKSNTSDAYEDAEAEENTSSASQQDIALIFNYWKEKTGRTNQWQLTRKRKGAIGTRLKRFTVDELMTAIDSISASPWHQGDNPNQKKYDTFGHPWFKDMEKLEGWARGGVSREDRINRLREVKSCLG